MSALRSLLPLVAAAVVFAIAAFSPQIFNDGDTFWHIRTGQWILAHGQIPHFDLFSSTLPAHAWTAQEWLSEAVFAMAFNLLGWSGVALLTALAASLAAGLLVKALSRQITGVTLVLTSVTALAAFSPGLLARPHILALPFLVLWVDALVEARRLAKSPDMIGLPLLMVAWANLHGGFAFGLALIAPFILEKFWKAPGAFPQRFKKTKEWLFFAALATAAALLTPNGVSGLLFPLQLTTMPDLSRINEWGSADFSHLTPLEIIMLLGAGVGLGRGVRLEPMPLAVVLVLTHLALLHQRHLILLGVVGSLLMAGPIALHLQGAERTPGPALKKGKALAAAPVLLALFIMAAVRVIIPLTLPDSPDYPVLALRHVPSAYRSDPVFNEYDFGGALIFEGVHPFIDGRADLYGPAYLANYEDATRPNAQTFLQIVQKRAIRWTILKPSDPLAALLDFLPGWRRIYSDRFAVIHVRG